MNDDIMLREREVKAAEKANSLKEIEIYLDVIKELLNAEAIDKEEYVRDLMKLRYNIARK